MGVSGRTLLIVIVSFLFVNCEKQVSPHYTSFRDIPGVTADEISAIEAFQQQNISFVYGMTPSIEAFRTENGEIKGFAVLFCNWLTEFFGIPFVPAMYDWDDLLEGLRSGEIDFTGELTATEERRKTWFMTDGIASRPIKYFRLAGSVPFEEIAQSRLLRYAFFDDTTTEAIVQATLVPGTYESVYVHNRYTAYNLLKNGEVDAIITEGTAEADFDMYGDMDATDYFPLIFEPVSMTTQNPELEPVISVVEKILLSQGIRYLAELYTHGHRDYMRHKMRLWLTDEENEYIKNNPVVPIAAEHDIYPISFYNKRENAWQGIYFDLLDEIALLTGLSFDLVHDHRTKWPAIYEMLLNGEVSIVPELFQLEEREGLFLWPDMEMQTDFYALISKSDYPNITTNEIPYVKVGLTRGTAYTAMFNYWFPNHMNTLEYDGMEEVFDALQRGEVDVVMATRNRLLHLTNYLELPGYKVNLMFNYPEKNKFGFSRNEEMLRSIIDKALHLINTKGIADQWVWRTYDYRVKLAEARLPWLLGGAALLLCVLVLLFILYRKKRFQGRQLEDLVQERAGELIKRNALMKMVNDTAALLLDSDIKNYSDAVGRSMKMVCHCVEVDIITLFQNTGKNYGKLYYKQLCKWKDGEGQINDDEQELPYDTLPGWEKCLSRGDILNGPLDRLPATEGERFKPDGVVSLLAIPLFIKGEFWGFVSFDDCRKRRVFDQGEAYVLQSWGLLMVSAIQRNKLMLDMQQALSKQEAALVEAGKANDLTQIMFNAMPLGCHLWDQNTNLLDCNIESLRLFDIGDKDTYRKSFPGLSPEYQPDGRPSGEVVEYLNKMAFEEGIVVSEFMHQKLNGEPVPTELVLTRIKLNNEEDGIVTYLRDLREQKAMLAEIHKVQDDLRHARDIAEESSRAKSSFLANMSHEIRTPMNSIIGFSELALGDNITDKTRDYLNKIMLNSEWLLQIINDILDISKIESGKMELEKIPFDLHELFTACRTIITPKAEEKGINLNFYAEPSIGKKLLGDPTRLRQVLLNILSNAVKFTNADGTVKVSATVNGLPNGNITINFSIRDNGIGMTSEQITKVSEPFIQAEAGTTRKYGGTGLGLAISKNIVEMMGGKLNVESTLGVGSKFSFELTFDTIETAANASDTLYVSEVDRPQFDGEILLCEDNRMNQQVLCEHLKRIGLRADVAENGREGYNMVQRRFEKNEKPYDLIFMDIHMPIMDGIAAASLINGLDTGTPIIAMTANIMSHDRELYLKNGMHDCVGKPFVSQELWRCLLKYLTPVKWQSENKVENKQENDQLRHKLIASFVKDNQNRYGEIVDAMETGDIKLANRLAHTLKGNAGILEKPGLQKAAENIENLLKDGKNLVKSKHLKILKTELSAVLDELAPLVKENTQPQPPAEPLAPEKARELLAEIKPLLESGNPECLEYTDALRGIPGSEELIQQMEDLDFELALVTLNGLKYSD